MPPLPLRIYSLLTFQQLALKEHDDKQLYIARQNLSDMRNVYAVVTDILHKNILKVLPILSWRRLQLNIIRSFARPKVITASACIDILYSARGCYIVPGGTPPSTHFNPVTRTPDRTAHHTEIVLNILKPFRAVLITAPGI